MPYGFRELDHFWGYTMGSVGTGIWALLNSRVRLTSPHPCLHPVSLGALTLWGMAKAYGLVTIGFFQRYEPWEQVAGGADAVCRHRPPTLFASELFQVSAVRRCRSLRYGHDNRAASVVADVTPNEATPLYRLAYAGQIIGIQRPPPRRCHGIRLAEYWERNNS